MLPSIVVPPEEVSIPGAIRTNCDALLKLTLFLISMPVLPLPSEIPASLLWSVWLPTMSELEVPVTWMPFADRPLIGCPANDTWLLSIVIFEELLTEMPGPVVWVMANPWILTKLRPEMVQPLVCPRMVTVAPVAAVNTIGAVDVPEFAGLSSSAYWPALTLTVWPATATDAALEMVQNGCVWVPAPLSEQLLLFLSTNSVGATAWTGVLFARSMAASQPPRTSRVAGTMRPLPRRVIALPLPAGL